jgi:DNA-binding CsgD family transcriptional regulator
VSLCALARPRVAARLLVARAGPVALAAIFAVAGVLDPGIQQHYGGVAPAIVAIAAIVSSARWTVLTALVCASGYVAGLALAGHSLEWMLVGDGQRTVVRQLADLAMSAAAMLLVVALLHAFLRGAPARISRARLDATAITPYLALAVREPGQRLLKRADSADVIVSLTAAERAVLALLERGRAPKQIARELHVTLATVRSHIASAKRRTGARTIEQLVALHAEGTRGG